MRYWLVKSEPDVFGIDDLQRDGTTSWEGVRNYQARNFMRDDMKRGDRVLFYHSNSTPPGVVGTATICREAYPDLFAQTPDHKYFDPKATPEDPRWVMVDLAFASRFADVVSLAELKAEPDLAEMLVVQRGQRLSVQPVDAAHFERVLEMAAAKGPITR